MGNGYPVVQPDELADMKALIQSAFTKIRELERPTGTQLSDAVATLQDLVNGLLNQVNVTATGTVTAGGRITSTGDTFWSTYALANPVVTGYFALYVNSDGRFGRTVSARRYKQNIKNFSPASQAAFALQLRQFRLKQAVEEMGDSAPIEHGLIAEELIDLGLDWLVQFGPDGQAESVAYEKVALALIPAIQELGRVQADHEKRLRKAGL
jgi:hypothetical protein